MTLRYARLFVALALSTFMLASCSGDDPKPPATGPADMADTEVDMTSDLPPLLDNGCPAPPADLCDDGISCTADSYTVDPITCTFECLNVPLCEDDDGCCAPGCNPSNDNDCSAECGNDYLDPGELCDGDCPTTPADCGLANACETAIIVGDAETCDARCFVLPIDRCIDGDGCCPDGCVAEDDDDCSDQRLGLGDVCTSSHQCPRDDGAIGLCHGFAWENDQQSICTRPCDDASECPGGWLCESNLCRPPCQDTTDCTTGLTCVGPTPFDPPEYCEYQPWHPRTEFLGSACEFGYQCRGRTDIIAGSCLREETTGWPNGYCVQRICQENTDCGLDGQCISGQCFDGCQAGGDCRAGYECNDYFGVGKRICAPPLSQINIGQACESEADCTGNILGRECRTDQPEGSCTAPCATDEDCPVRSICDPGAGQCIATCLGGTCRDGYACVDLGLGTACYPARGGNRALGSSCDSSGQCFGYSGLYPICLEQTDGFVGGYCSAIGCAQGECGDEGVCVIDEEASIGSCFLECEPGSPCRPGYTCEPHGDTGICIPGTTGDRSIGDPCTENSQCPGECVTELQNPDALDGYCTRACDPESEEEDDACPADTRCVQGQCLPDCTPGNDACPRFGYSCRDIDDDFEFECVPIGGDGPQASGEVCNRDWQCSRDGAQCASVNERRICAVECVNDQCPEGALCDPTTTLCLQSCDTTSDCRVGFSCELVPGSDTDRFCDYGVFRLGAF